MPWIPFKYLGEAENAPKNKLIGNLHHSMSIQDPEIPIPYAGFHYFLFRSAPPGTTRKPLLYGGFMAMPPARRAFQHLPFRQCSLLPTTFTGLADGNEESPWVGLPHLRLSDHGEAANTHVAGTQCTPCSHEMRGPDGQSQLPPQDSAISPMKGVGQ